MQHQNRTRILINYERTKTSVNYQLQSKNKLQVCYKKIRWSTHKTSDSLTLQWCFNDFLVSVAPREMRKMVFKCSMKWRWCIISTFTLFMEIFPSLIWQLSNMGVQNWGAFFEPSECAVSCSIMFSSHR